jgi:hypothetical protein
MLLCDRSVIVHLLLSTVPSDGPKVNKRSCGSNIFVFHKTKYYHTFHVRVALMACSEDEQLKYKRKESTGIRFPLRKPKIPIFLQVVESTEQPEECKTNTSTAIVSMTIMTTIKEET